MPSYDVEVIALSREIYRVEAGDPGEAMSRWATDGTLRLAEDYKQEATGVVETR